MRFLTVQQITRLHDEGIALFGGDPGILDYGKLQSAVVAPQYYRLYAGADIVGCAASYAYNVMQAHAFADGNKRVGHYSVRTFVEVNGHRLNASRDQLFGLYMAIASGIWSRDAVESQFRQWIAPTNVSMA
jgi:death-on-curing family protein